MTILSESLLFAFALLDTGVVLFLLVYFWIIPKIAAHSFLDFLMLIHGQWLLALVNLPMTMWLCYEYFTIPRGNLGVFDPTEIHNRGQLKKHNRDCMIYLGYNLIFFFIYLYCLIIALLRGDPINRKDDDVIEF
ncbi:hypothetical protein G9C98_005673 [Cotesia typhae]|uniref:Uncharacterized protein n=1 Tax=Cotesia typhae TaxID=2053667 RepID=A0A8J5R3B2_9HYME|nr:hypothetical protein G9C98_005673 [Cotesia typhae]